MNHLGTRRGRTRPTRAARRSSPLQVGYRGAISYCQYVVAQVTPTDVISLGPNNSVRFLRCSTRCPELMRSKWRHPQSIVLRCFSGSLYWSGGGGKSYAKVSADPIKSEYYVSADRNSIFAMTSTQRRILVSEEAGITWSSARYPWCAAIERALLLLVYPRAT